MAANRWGERGVDLDFADRLAAPGGVAGERPRAYLEGEGECYWKTERAGGGITFPALPRNDGW
jgi:hypothetical protein